MTYGNHCVQIASLAYPDLGFPEDDDEDCLFVNVWVPNGVQPGGNKPVMVYFYGGAYLFGTGAMYPCHDLAVNADVITVNFNYRLGGIGFMATGDNTSPGNYALWDCKAALEWVRDNIASFGGDPSKVTIFGQSAGAHLADFMLTSPQTRGLFRSAIIISGASMGPVGYTDRGLQVTQLLADWLGCPVDDNTAKVQCLREEDADDIDFGGLVAPILEGYLPGFAPVIDGTFLTKPPQVHYQEGFTAPYNLMIGSTNHDGAGFVILNVLGVNEPDHGPAEDPEEFEGFLRLVVRSMQDNENASLARIVQRYPGLQSDEVLTRAQAGTQMSTDWWFTYGSHLEAGWHARANSGSGRSYVYSYQYRQSFHGYPAWVNGSHLDDIYSVLGEPFMEVFRTNVLRGEYNDEDKRMRDVIHTYYHNFAYNGDPSVGRPVAVAWPRYQESDRKFARLSAYMTPASIETETADMTERFNFWYNLMQERDRPGRHVLERPAYDYDYYSVEDVIEALDAILPIIVPTYQINRDAFARKAEEMFHRAESIRASNRRRWRQDS